jgi:tetratricopeptide (TPR) repeat protein
MKRTHLILFLTGVLGLYGFSGICQEAHGYTDIRDGSPINISVDIDEQTGNVSKQLLLHHFLFFPPAVGESLDAEESFRIAAILQGEYANWSDFAKLIHLVPLAEEQRNDPKVTNAIKSWATKHRAMTTVVANTDAVVISEVGARGTPLMHVSLYHLNGELWKFDTEDPRNPIWKRKFFQLMDTYFGEHFKLNEVQDWLTWLENMKKVLPVNLFNHYFELGQDRLRKGNQGIDYRALPICEAPPLLSNQQDSQRIDIAIRAFQGAIREKPNEPEAHNYLGTSYYRKRDYSNALPSFQNAMNLNPTEPTYLHNLVMAFCKQGEAQKAIETLDRWLEQHPDDQRAREIRKHLVGGREVGLLGTTTLPLFVAGLGTLIYTEITPRTPRENADDEFQQIVSTGESTPLAPESPEFETLRIHWGDYQKLNRRAAMLDVTGVNLMVNSIPFWLDGLNWKSPFGKRGMSLAYGAKGVAFSVAALIYAGKANDAEKDANDPNTPYLKPHFHGRHQQADETRRMLWFNAGIDAATVIGLLVFYNPNDEASGCCQGENRQASNRSVLPLDIDVRSDGRHNREILVSFHKSFK